jgi:hypothetical protein
VLVMVLQGADGGATDDGRRCCKEQMAVLGTVANGVARC